MAKHEQTVHVFTREAALRAITKHLAGLSDEELQDVLNGYFGYKMWTKERTTKYTRETDSLIQNKAEVK